VIDRRHLRQSPQSRFIRALPLKGSPLNFQLLTFNLPLFSVPTFQPSNRPACKPSKSFSCNTYGSPRKCCKQKTYATAKSFKCNTYKKQGVGAPIIVNQALEAKHLPSSSALCLRASVAASSSIFRTLFQVPYPATPLFATLTKTAGVCTNNSHSGTRPVCSPTRPQPTRVERPLAFFRSVHSAFSVISALNPSLSFHLSIEDPGPAGTVDCQPLLGRSSASHKSRITSHSSPQVVSYG
jgi:hypothetical protein